MTVNNDMTYTVENEHKPVGEMRGDRLRDLRISLGYTQETLAERAKIGLRQIWRYENEESEPSGNTVANLAQILGTSADYLLGLTDDPMPYSMRLGEMTARERAILSALRYGRIIDAIRYIVLDD